MSPADRARENACSVEARKLSYRQTKDGIAVTLLLHPQEVPQRLTLAPLGSRWMVAMVEIDDDEQPKEVRDTAASTQRISAAVPVTPTEPGRPKRDPLKKLAMQAGICCTDPVFWRFLRENDMPASSEDEATTSVRFICAVGSRAEIRPGTEAGERWQELHGKFEAWKLIG